jgi:hypothetical protein
MMKKVLCLVPCAMLFALCFSVDAQQSAKATKPGWSEA